MLALCLLLLLPAADLAAQQRALRCPEGHKRRFSGEPLRPMACVKPASPEDADGRGLAPAIAAKASPETKLKDLLGRWQGMTQAGGSRYELLFEIRASKGGVWLARLASKDYELHRKNTLWARLEPTDSAGQFRADAWLDSLPELGLDGWLQLKPLHEPTYDRLAEFSYDLRSGLHEVRFKLKDKQTIAYAYRRIDGGGFSGELKKTDAVEPP